MRKIMFALLAGGLVAISGQLMAQQQDENPVRSNDAANQATATEGQSQDHQFCRSSDLIGTEIRLESGSNDNVGQVEDVLFDEDSRMAHYLVVEYDPSILAAGKYMIVPWSAAEFHKATEQSEAFVMLKITPERIKQAPTITGDQLEKLDANKNWMTQVNEFYRYELPQSHRVLKPNLNEDRPAPPVAPQPRESDTNQ